MILRGQSSPCFQEMVNAMCRNQEGEFWFACENMMGLYDFSFPGTKFSAREYCLQVSILYRKVK